MLIWQKYLKVLGQVSSALPSSTSKYQVLEILHQVQSTKYKYFTWPQPWCNLCVPVGKTRQLHSAIDTTSHCIMRWD